MLRSFPLHISPSSPIYTLYPTAHIPHSIFQSQDASANAKGGQSQKVTQNNHDLQVRFKWGVNYPTGIADVAIWDNRSTSHSVSPRFFSLFPFSFSSRAALTPSLFHRPPTTMKNNSELGTASFRSARGLTLTLWLLQGARHWVMLCLLRGRSVKCTGLRLPNRPF